MTLSLVPALFAFAEQLNDPSNSQIYRVTGWFAQYGLWASAGVICVGGSLWGFARFNPYVSGMHSGLRWLMTGLAAAFSIGLAGSALTIMTNLWWTTP